MHIALGSSSKRKFHIVELLLKTFFSETMHITGEEVSSGVPETPYDQETKLGAANRAKQIHMRFAESDLSIGLESGLVKRYGDLYEEAWACVIDKDGNVYYGYSSGLKVPEMIVTEMKKGMKHAAYMAQFDEVLGIDTKDTWGSYSGKLLSRDVSLEEALRNALIQIIAGEKSFYNMKV